MNPAAWNEEASFYQKEAQPNKAEEILVKKWTAVGNGNTVILRRFRIQVFDSP